MRARRARLEDAPAIYRLIAYYAGKGLLLPRAKDEIRAHISHFLVLAENGQLLGCVALESYGADLAEIRSLAVEPDTRGRGVGARLVQFALAMARRRKIARAFAVTHAPDFFIRQGFAPSTRRALPEKIARDCCACPKASHCELVAVIAAVCPERITLPLHSTTAEAAPAPRS